MTLLSHGGLADLQTHQTCFCLRPFVLCSRDIFTTDTIMACCTLYLDFCSHVISLERASINSLWKQPHPHALSCRPRFIFLPSTYCLFHFLWIIIITLSPNKLLKTRDKTYFIHVLLVPQKILRQWTNLIQHQIMLEILFGVIWITDDFKDLKYIFLRSLNFASLYDSWHFCFCICFLCLFLTWKSLPKGYEMNQEKVTKIFT